MEIKSGVSLVNTFFKSHSKYKATGKMSLWQNLVNSSKIFEVVFFAKILAKSRKMP